MRTCRPVEMRGALRRAVVRISKFVSNLHSESGRNKHSFVAALCVDRQSGLFVKMVLVRVSGGKLERIFSLGLLLLVTARGSTQQGSSTVSYIRTFHSRGPLHVGPNNSIIYTI